MYEKVPKRVKLSIVLFLTAILVLNLQALFPVAEGVDEAADDVDGSRILTDEEVRSMGMTDPPGDPTRSEPWNAWERYHFPSGGESGAAVYYAPKDRVYIYGGGYRTQYGHTAYDDLYYYDLNTNKWVALEKAFGPAGRYRFSDAYDDVNEKLYLYGGYESGSMMDDLWEFDLKTEQWSRIVSSSAIGSNPRRVGAPMVVDTTANELYIHMGQGDQTQENANLSGFIKIDLTSPSSTPTQLNDGTSSGMLKRMEHDMCIDESGKKIYMFGGYNTDMGYLKEFWIYDIVTNQWSFVPTPPDMGVLYGAKMFFRPLDQTVNLWGGRNSSTGSDENQKLWTFDTQLTTWSSMEFSDPANGRLLFHDNYCASADRFVAFAGRYYSGYQSGRYHDLNYLDLGTMSWTSFPTNDTGPGSVSNGIFAYDEPNQRIYVVGPNTGYYNSTGYTYYWDILDKNWYGPFYNTGPSNPHSRSRAGMAFDAANMTVYFYGGMYTEGQRPTRYYDLKDIWKIDLRTHRWELVMPEAGPGERYGFDLVFNPNDGMIYFYGGGDHPTTDSSFDIYHDFYKFNPRANSFQQIFFTGAHPNGRYGMAACVVEETNSIYFYGGTEDTGGLGTDRRDLWRYDISTDKWTELDKASSRVQAELDYDPLTKELYLTGGDSNDIYRYRILEDAWYLWYPVPNPGTQSGGHAHMFDPATRDLWVFGSGAKSGIWKIGIPPRLAIQSAYFKDPDEGDDLAYAMLREYTFGTSVKMVNGKSDLSRITVDLSHSDGSYVLEYNYTVDTAGGNGWTERDPKDYAEIVGEPRVSWDGLIINLEVDLKFHWNWTQKSQGVDRLIAVRAYGIGVSRDELFVRDFLRVRNRIAFLGQPVLEGSIQGAIEDGDWVQTGELVTFSGPKIVYSPTSDVYPPDDTYELNFWRVNDLVETLTTLSGQALDHTYPAPEADNTDVRYTMNISGVNDATSEVKLVWNISVDGTPPTAPDNLQIHDEDAGDTPIIYDNDLEVILTWQAPTETLSGIKTYYWSFEDAGGTRDGTPINGNQLDITLPGDGSNTIYLWTEDNVGNIGPSANVTVLVDREPIQFTLVSPDIERIIPYDTLDLKFNITDIGGSRIVSQSIQYRYSNDGQGSDMWVGTNAWKFLPDLWTSFQKNSYDFTISTGKNGVPKLQDGDENFIQLKARDGAGSEFVSEVYQLNIDTTLRFPDVTLVAPRDGAEFEDPDDVVLNWTVDFFAPEDVVYELYISDVKAQVDIFDQSIKRDVFELSYQPDFLVFGKYYWTIRPVAKGQWIGTCSNGVFSFTLTNEDNYAFQITTENLVHKYKQGQAGIPITFEVTNSGQEIIWLQPDSDLAGVATVTWALLGVDGYQVNIGETRDIVGQIYIKETAPVGSHELSFYFLSQRAINRTVTISVDVLTKEVGPADDDEETFDVGLLLVFGIIGVAVIMVIIAALYFLVIKKRSKKRTATEAQLDRLESELVEGGRSGRDKYGLAPAPKGLRKSHDRPGISSPEGQDNLPPAQAEPQLEQKKLVEEGSEDDWMNLVAAETMAAEVEEEIIESQIDQSDHEKSLQDLLAEMSSDVEIEDD